MDLILRPLLVADEAESLRAHAELAADGFELLLDRSDGEPWAAYVERLGRLSRGVDVPAGRVPATFLVAEAGGVIVGRTSVRHALNDWLASYGGHIGYGVRPAYRRQGVATEILRQSLGIARGVGVASALLTCDDTNVGSATVIERCGGVLEDVVTGPDGTRRRRYWVPTA